MSGYGLLNHYLVLLPFSHRVAPCFPFVTVQVTVKYVKREKAEICNYAYCSQWLGLQKRFFSVWSHVLCVSVISSSPELVLKKILFGYFNSAEVVHISLPWFKLCPKMQQVEWLLTVYK